MSRLLLALLLLQAVSQTSAPTPTPQAPTNTTPQAPANTTPAAPGAVNPPDPAEVMFATDLGMILVAVKPDKVADYEAAVIALQEAMAASEDADTRKVASGWLVYKAAELDAKANALYVHMLQPAVAGVDYRPSMWLDKLLSGAPADLLAKYRDAFAGPPTKLPLAEFADMSKEPVRPANASPAGPQSPPTPGNTTPAKPGNVPPPGPAKPGNVPPPGPLIF